MTDESKSSDGPPISKYAAKGKRPYRYSFAGCLHNETYMDRYAVPDGEFRRTFYTVLRCKNCDLILGDPRAEPRRER